MRLVALVLVGCGGSIAGPTIDASSEAPLEAAPTPAVDCAALKAKLDARRQELKVCCPFCNSLQCQHVLSDYPCCSFTSNATSAADFDADGALYKASCAPSMGACKCATPTVGRCVPVGNNQGICQ